MCLHVYVCPWCLKDGTHFFRLSELPLIKIMIGTFGNILQGSCHHEVLSEGSLSLPGSQNLKSSYSESVRHSVVSDSLQPHELYSPLGSSGILQARTLEWVAIPVSRGSSQPRDQTWFSHIVGRLFTI